MISPLFSASIIAASSTVGPRQVLMKYAVGFIALKKSAPTSLRVSSLRGVCMDTKSESAASSSRVATGLTRYSFVIHGGQYGS